MEPTIEFLGMETHGVWIKAALINTAAYLPPLGPNPANVEPHSPYQVWGAGQVSHPCYKANLFLYKYVMPLDFEVKPPLLCHRMHDYSDNMDSFRKVKQDSHHPDLKIVILENLVLVLLLSFLLTIIIIIAQRRVLGILHNRYVTVKVNGRMIRLFMWGTQVLS